MRELSKQFARFAACGAVGTLAHYLLLICLVQALRVPPVVAASAGFMLGAFVNFRLNYRYTFRSNKPHREAMWKFFLVALIGALINAVFMSILVHRVNLNYVVAQIVATGILLVWNFLINRIWTFRN